MRKCLFSLAGMLLFLSARTQSITPTVVNSSGGSGISGTGPNTFFLDWNVGEMTLVNTMRSTGKKILIITNGFLQPEYSGDQGQEPERKIIPLLTGAEIMAYPNPASDHVNVSLQFDEPGTVRLVLLTVMGEQLFSRQVAVEGRSRVEQVPVANYTPGTYLLQVQFISEGQIISQGSFKIIKTD